MPNKSDFKIQEIFEQEATFDGKWKLSINAELLMRIINDMAATDEEDVAEMKDPKRIIVRVIIETRDRGRP